MSEQSTEVYEPRMDTQILLRPWRWTARNKKGTNCDMCVLFIYHAARRQYLHSNNGRRRSVLLDGIPASRKRFNNIGSPIYQIIRHSHRQPCYTQLLLVLIWIFLPRSGDRLLMDCSHHLWSFLDLFLRPLMCVLVILFLGEQRDCGHAAVYCIVPADTAKYPDLREIALTGETTVDLPQASRPRLAWPPFFYFIFLYSFILFLFIIIIRRGIKRLIIEKISTCWENKDAANVFPHKSPVWEYLYNG